MAGSLTNLAETALLELLFKNTDWANVGDAAGLQNSAAAGTFTIHLYTAAPSDSAAGTECDYTDYAPVAVARSGAGWTVAGNNASNTAAIAFPTAGATVADTAVAFGIKTGVGGDLLVWGDITAPAGGLVISTGVTPTFAIGELDINCD